MLVSRAKVETQELAVEVKAPKGRIGGLPLNHRIKERARFHANIVAPANNPGVDDDDDPGEDERAMDDLNSRIPNLILLEHR